MIQPEFFHNLFASVRIWDEEGPNNSVLLRDGWCGGAKISQQPQTIQRREAGGGRREVYRLPWITPPPREGVTANGISPTRSLFSVARISYVRLSMEPFSSHGRRFLLRRQIKKKKEDSTNHIYARILCTFVRTENTKIR